MTTVTLDTLAWLREVNINGT